MVWTTRICHGTETGYGKPLEENIPFQDKNALGSKSKAVNVFQLFSRNIGPSLFSYMLMA